ncbi:hypothetical protein EYV94_15955 [Puteibacter caeruleilacunae]|nr:hypothetical protein EYV94_15955 [Puteibacter caeruleilacunae]
MKSHRRATSALLIGVTSIGIVGNSQAIERMKQHEQPNFVVVMCDDVSYDMFECYGNKRTKTPNIDRLAQQGVMFRTAWNSSLCSPARAEILTGNYATTTGFWSNGFSIPQKDGTDNLFHHYPAFSKVLNDNGYATAVAGKWHIGGSEYQYESIVGFDEYCMWEGVGEYHKITGQEKWDGGIEIPSLKQPKGSPDKTARYWHPCIIKNHEWVRTGPEDFGPDIFCDFICDFINRSAKNARPFLAYYPMTLPHGPYVEVPTRTSKGSNTPETDSAISNKQRFEEMINYIDILMGRILKQLEESRVVDNTIVIFTADNGTAVTAKSRGVERGVHIPLIVAGKSIQQRGITNEISDATDIFPTLLDFARVDVPRDCKLDGESLKPFLTGKTDSHKEVIHACIGTTQLLRTKEHLLEVVNPILGVPEGRFYYCGDNADGTKYVRAEDNTEYSEVYGKFRKILESKYIGLTEDHPVFKARRGMNWLKAYKRPKAVEKHLHNHKDYQVYDESLFD